ncbi:MAG: polar amino acid transport system permease protein [Anaerolineaceae bacterium]|nr:MAG: polar amino acid transport system permease protein [Anaerolineaceae bacterium]
MQASAKSIQPGSRRTSLAKLPWWAFILVATGVLLIYLILADQKYNETFWYLTQGIIVTLRITVISYFLATVIGLLVGLARMSKNVFINNAATLYVETMRGVPMVVLILYMAFVIIPIFVNSVQWVGDWGVGWTANQPWSPSTVAFWHQIFLSISGFSIRDLPMEGRAIIALAFGYGAYEAEVFRAGIQSIGKGQTEAARSLGMTYFQAMRFIILPQAIRRVLPPLGNDFIACLKDSSLVTVLAINDLTQLSRLRRSSTFRVTETFNVVTFLYLSMTLLLSGIVRWLEQRMKIEE